jgi:hypothetical protein
MKYTALLALYLLGACADKSADPDSPCGDSGDTACADTDDTGNVEPAPCEVAVSVTWSNVDGADPTDTNGDGLPDIHCGDTVDIEVTEACGETEWQFGMAETGAPNASGWTGEDCYLGYASYTYCHTIGNAATLNEVADCSVSSIVESSSTLLDASKDPFLTYYLSDSAGTCYVWGEDTTYYASQGCTELTP